MDSYVSAFEPIFGRFGREDSAGRLVIDSIWGNHDQFLIKRTECRIRGLTLVAVDLHYVMLDNKNEPMFEKRFFSATRYLGVELLHAVEDPNADEVEDNWIPSEYINSPEAVLAAILTKAEDKLDRVLGVESEMENSPHSFLHPDERSSA